MKLETASLDHTCNVIRRQFQEERPGLTLFFIVHAAGERDKALSAKRLELFRHPGGPALFTHLQALHSSQPEHSFFAGMVAEQSRSPLPFLRRKSMLAAFFVSTEDFEDSENPRPQIYQLAWHALSLAESCTNKEHDNFSLKGEIITTPPDAMKEARANMLADAFSAVLMALQGQKSFIRKLAKRRSLMAMQAIPGYEAELYPYPVTADAALLVYEEVLDTLSPKIPQISKAFEITKEIGLTYDDNTIRQWQGFAQAAQEMAWLRFDKSLILSAAIYTSEDAYVRAMAYLVSEILNLEPAPLSGLGTHNPFTEAEANERLHFKKCEEAFETALEKLKARDPSGFFFNEARRHNERLLESEVAGWAAPGFLKVSEFYKTAVGDAHALAEAAKILFDEENRKISWQSLSEISRIVMRARRRGAAVTSMMLAALCEGHDQFTGIVESVEKAAWETPAAF
jgi:hypothetical protein